MSTLKRLFIFITCTFIHIVLSKKSNKDSYVTDLTDANFDRNALGTVWMVKFYTPWCGHCKKYAPIFEETADITYLSDGYIHFGQVDCESEDKLCADYHVTGYPTTLLLFNGKLIANYRESRNSATKIRSWIIRQLDAEHLKDADLLSDDDIKSITNAKQKWLRGYRSDSDYIWEDTNTKLSFFAIPSMKDIYYSMLGDISPTIPFIIYLLGTLSGIVIGVCFVVCAA